MKPDLTIGVPVYNEEKYIANTIASIQKQSFKDFRIYILDDQSTDDSYSIVSKLAQFDQRISLSRNKDNLGNLSTFLQLLKASKTQFFGWVGAHDLLDEHYIDRLMNEIQKNSTVNYVYGDLFFIDESNNYLGKDEEKLLIPKNHLKNIKNYSDMIGQCRKGGINFHGIYRKEILSNFWETQKNTYVGWDHVILSRANFFGVKYVSDAVYKMRKFNSRPSTTYTRLIPKQSSLVSIKPNYIHLLMGYYKDFLSLNVSLLDKIKGLILITQKVPNQYNFSLLKNFILYILFLFKTRFGVNRV
jgi:glycosyltransferase involved in cell wall biosynthesis